MYPSLKENGRGSLVYCLSWTNVWHKHITCVKKTEFKRTRLLQEKKIKIKWLLTQNNCNGCVTYRQWANKGVNSKRKLDDINQLSYVPCHLGLKHLDPSGCQTIDPTATICLSNEKRKKIYYKYLSKHFRNRFRQTRDSFLKLFFFPYFHR